MLDVITIEHGILYIGARAIQTFDRTLSQLAPLLHSAFGRISILKHGRIDGCSS